MRSKHDPVGGVGGAAGSLPGAMRAAAAVRWAIVAAVLVAVAAPVGTRAARPSPKPPAASGAFVENFDTYDATRWSRADGWKNGSPFDNGWRADHVSVESGQLDLRLDDVPTLGEPYASGELRSNGFYGYGCYEASFRPIMVPGVVTSLFTFAGPYDNGGNGKHNEIDIEFLGNSPQRVQLNFWTNDDGYASRNEVLLELGFDPTAAFHRYGFKWTVTGIEWFVDGQRVYSVADSALNPTPKATESLQKIMMNTWPVDDTAALWAGEFVYPGTALHANYAWVRYVAGKDCSLTDPPIESPPPSGDPESMSVRDISLALGARATQVIARVSIVDGLGRGVSGATVGAGWSGVISTGDTSRTTDAGGVATFYSSRTRNPGTVQFCVNGVSHGSLLYTPDANLETCDVITK